MSLTLEKLRALKRQAGASLEDASAGARPPADGKAGAPSESGDSSLPAAPRTGAHTPPWEALVPSSMQAPTAHRDNLSGHDSPHAFSPATAAPGTSSPALQGAAGSLRRLLGIRGHAVRTPRARTSERGLPGTQIDDGLWLIESHVADPAPCTPLPLAFARRDGHVDARDVLFFDTETTGLAGGTGTRAFMIGAADWQGDVLRIRQLLIANMAAEAAMLRMFAQWLSPSTVLASYNGRSYDAPLLRTRYRLARQPDALHGLDHLDLLHPSRRRWRGRWENCRLATIEREALRIMREDDLPGSQAPAAWLSYLRGGASTNLCRVVEHNRQDVSTLARLLVCLSDEQSERP